MSRRASIVTLSLFFVLLLLPVAAAQNETNNDDDSAEVEDTSFSGLIGVEGFFGDLIDTLVWVFIGVGLIIFIIWLVDLVTDKMKNDWFNLADFVGQPTAMAIFASGLMIAVSIVIGATILSA